jgi:predicted hotdog family 3-hydroxylacyl-ACP dehydratase
LLLEAVMPALFWEERMPGIMKIEKEEMMSLLPHRGKMLLLSRIGDYSMEERSLSAEYDITEDCIFYDPVLGGVPGWAGFECMAQAISALSGLTGRQKGEKAKIGFILSVSSMKIDTPLLKAGKKVQVRVREDSRVDLVYNFKGEIFFEDKKAAEAKLTVMDVDESFVENIVKRQ